MKIDKILLKDRLERYRTNHILHLLLTIFTGGIWFWVWMLVTISNALERSRIERLIRGLE